MNSENESFCGFEDGQDWLDDLAIKEYMLNRRVEIPKIRKETHESEI